MPPAPGIVERLQPLLGNDLPPAVDHVAVLTGLIGDAPSRYSKSPAMWNAAFAALGIDSIYVPMDVTGASLAALMRELRATAALAGCTVTVPHKLAVMELIDEVDPRAGTIGAVNTVVRAADGTLSAFNTDGDGLVASIRRAMPGQSRPFIESLAGMRALLIGAGGTGRSAAFALARELDGGTLLIANRSLDRSLTLVANVAQVFPGVRVVASDDIAGVLPDVDLVVNASTVGQSGVRHFGGHQVTCLEPYSPLARANPAVFDAGQHANEETFFRAWHEASWNDIEANQEASAAALAHCRTETVFVDVVYDPPETALLRQARLAGHRTLNGNGMLVMQAVEAMVRRIMRGHLLDAGHDLDAAYSRALEAMAAAW